MNRVPENLGDDVFDGESDVRGVFERSVPKIKPINVDDLIAQCNEVTVAPKRIARVTRRSLLAASGVVACSLAGSTIIWLRPTDSFAQVQARVGATKSVRYVVRLLGDRANDDLQYTSMLIKEADHLRRETKEKTKDCLCGGG